MFGFDSVSCGNYMHVGAYDSDAVGTLRGSVTLQGPIHAGDNNAFAGVDATFMLATLKNEDCDTPSYSFYVKGDTKQEGDYYHYGNMEHYGDSYHEGCFTVVSPPWCNSEFTANLNIVGWVHTTQEITSGSYMTAAGTVTGSEVIASGVTLTSRKPFDIPHPTKSGWRLRHVCLEGPESGVYFRGRLKGKNTIELPDYWDGLVDTETITVQLTQIGFEQNLIVEKIEWGKIIKIKSGNGSAIDCYYHVYGERKDGEKLIVEYEGTSIDDYPGDNSIYSINK